VGNGWYRCSVTATPLSTTTIRIQWNIVTSATSPRVESYAGDGTSGLFIWGAQLEVGSFPTTYITTTSASVTRNADTFQLSNVFTNNLISSAGGTWFVDLRNNIERRRDGFAGNDFFLSTTTGPFAGDNFLIANWVLTSRLQIIKCVSGSSAVLYTTTANTAKIAIKWNGTTADIFENGIKVISATAFPATAMENLRTNILDVPRAINSMALYNTPLSDAECIQITTL
jgi:hypothetical protein